MIGLRVGLAAALKIGVACGSGADELGGDAEIGTLGIGFGDSNENGISDYATGDNGLDLGAPFAAVPYNMRRAIAVNDPPVWFDTATTTLRPYNSAGTSNMGAELTWGRNLSANGFPIFIGKIGMSGSKAAEWNGFLAPYLLEYIDARITETGRRLGLVEISLGSNDANNSTDANAFAANMTAIVAAIRARYGSQVYVLLRELPSACIETHKSTVRTQALAFIAATPRAALVRTDDLTLTDGRHFDADSYAVIGSRIAYRFLDLAGLDRYVPTGSAPEVVGSDPGTRGVGAMSPTVHASARAGDKAYLEVSTGNIDVTPALTTPQSFTEVVGSAQSSDLGGNKQRCLIWECAVTQEMLDANGGLVPTPVVADTNSSLAAKIYVVRGPNGVATTKQVNGGVNNAFVTGLTIPGVTTTSANNLILMFSGGYSNIANSVVVTNATLTSVAEFQDSSLSTGIDFRQLALTTGVKATAGATGNATATQASAAVLHGVTIAVEP